MNSKVWLVIFGLFALVLIGGAGYYCMGAYGKYSEALSTWDSTKGAISGLERRVPYPSEKNKVELQKKVDGYNVAVKQLFQSLNKFQKQLDTKLQNTDFQQLVKTKVEGFRTFAASGGMSMDAADEFQMGFDTYANTLPSPESVPVLHYELEAIDLLLRDLVTAGAEQLLLFSRDLIPGEVGGPTEKKSGVVHKYPVRVKFHGSHEAFRKFINRVANSKEYFYIVRVLKVTNDVKEGPLKPGSAGGGEEMPRFIKSETREMADREQLQEWGYPEVNGADLEVKAREAGFEVATEDARVLMGQEKLTVFMVIDITRFDNPEKATASTSDKKDTEKGGSKR